MNVFDFKLGDAVPYWVILDELNPESEMNFGCDGQIFIEENCIRWFANSPDEILVIAGNDCSGRVIGNPNGIGDLICDFSRIEGGGKFPLQIPPKFDIAQDCGAQFIGGHWSGYEASWDYIKYMGDKS